jgi:hypothetical protein
MHRQAVGCRAGGALFLAGAESAGRRKWYLFLLIIAPKPCILISDLNLNLLIQTRMIQKPLLWVEVGKTACVLVGICELRLYLAG